MRENAKETPKQNTSENKRNWRYTMTKELKFIGIALVFAMMITLFGIRVGAAGTVHYIDANGESQLRSDATELTGSLSSRTLTSGWYVITGTTSATFTIDGDVHLILADGAVSNSKIFVPFGDSVTIYGQQQQTGKLNGTIGGHKNYVDQGCGDITINGGVIVANGDYDYAGIGAARETPENKTGNITINGGNITAVCQGAGADSSTTPIGSYNGSANCTITINGGTIVAKSDTYYDGSRSYAVGIGSVYGSLKGIVINGGTLDVFGDACGIGAEMTPITINGGNIKAVGNLNGPAIGSPEGKSGPITINGGYINALAKDATAIGAASSQSPGAPITITGGTIIAQGAKSGYGYGIGGNDYSGGNKAYDLIITGGSIFATRDGDAKYDYSPKAVLKDAGGNTITISKKEITLEGTGNGVIVLSATGTTHGMKDVQTVDGKIKLYLNNATTLPTKILTSNGLYLPKSEGNTTYVLHTSHTVDPVYTPHAEDVEKHNKHFTCCDEHSVENHLFSDAQHTCPCGAVAAAKVDGTFFVNFDNALRFAQSDGASSITLLSDVTIVDDINISGDILLDLAGKSLITSDKYMYALYLRTGTLTLKDSSSDKTGAIVANSAGIDTIGVENGTLGIESGNYGKIAVNSGTVTILNANIREFSIQEGTLVIQNGTFAKLSAPVNLQTTLLENQFFYDADGAIVDGRVTTLENVTVKTGVDLANSEATLEYTTTEYTALAKTPTLTLTVFDRVIAPEHFDIVYENNTLPGEATVTVKGKGVYTGEKTFTFTIQKGVLAHAENPTTTHEFGDIYSDKAITGGKIVIQGNADAVIEGTWAWVEGTPKARFTPDAQYDGLFEAFETEIDVDIVVTASIPEFTITAPAPSVIPQVNTPITVSAKNPYDDTLTDLPTEYKIIYRVGEDGEEVVVEGLVLTLPATVQMGETVYVRVENIAVEGKYAVATSTNTLTLTVGNIDYSAEIEDAKEELNQAILDLKAILENSNIGSEELSTKLQALQERMEEAEKLLETDNVTQSEMDETKAILSNALAELEQTKAILSDALAELEQNKTALETTRNDLSDTRVALESATEQETDNTVAVVAIVIGAISVLANLALGAYLFLFKRKGV